MNSNELKALVKEYFNLVEVEETAATEEFEATTEETVEEVVESFGEISDVNKAFTIKYPGEKLEVGDEVTVVTAEGQEMPAPDGTHMLEDGSKIVTEDSKVTEIVPATPETEAEATEVEAEEDSVDEEMEEVVIEVEEGTPSVEDIVKEIADAVAEQMKSMEEKMAALESKVDSILESPAAEPTITSTGKEMKSSFSKFDVAKAKNAKQIEMALSMIKNKK
jgi:uncharacterized coiled-coil protein SlyX